MKLSIIIPTFNEERTIEQSLKDVLALFPDEVIVIDGGSSDATVEIAKNYASVFMSPKGRACQMNEGARIASGNVLIFLHADTKLPQNALELIHQSVQSGRLAGRFRMQFDDRRLALRIFEIYTNLHHFSYGDQCFFVTRELFEKLEGYRSDVPFEDVDFYNRARKLTKPIILKEKVITSARRFTQVGCMRQKFINLFLVGMYAMGMDVTGYKKKMYTDIR